jgi:hypothetical protein
MRKYPFRTMKPGDSFTLPAGVSKVYLMRNYAQRYQARMPEVRFSVRKQEDGGILVECKAREPQK